MTMDPTLFCSFAISISFLPLLAHGSAEVDLALLSAPQPRKCEAIQSSICRDIGYNFTSMPNLAGIDNQKDAIEQLETFQPLIQVHCSSQLRFFLCSVYIPMCTDKVDFAIGPCKPLCESVKEKCQPVLQRFGFSWPAKLDCSLFPQANNPKTMCMKGPGEDRDPAEGTNAVNRHLPPLVGPVDPFLGELEPPPLPGGALIPPGPAPGQLAGCKIFKRPENLVMLNSTGTCALLCEKDQLFNAHQKQAITVWIGCIASFCLIFAVVAIITLIQRKLRTSFKNKIEYPELCLVFIALCYGFASVGYLIRVIGSSYAAFACADYKDFQLLVVFGLQNTRCTVVFLFIQYFGFAAACWWLLLCWTWYLIVGHGLDPARIEKWSSFFHFFGWATSAIVTVVLLVRQTIEADELTGICGLVNPQEMFRFLLIPKLVCLLTGMTLIVAGFFSFLCCAKPYASVPIDDKPSPSSTAASNNKLLHYPGLPLYAPNNLPPKPQLPASNRSSAVEAFHVKLGVLAGFYAVPQGALIAAYFYEYFYRESWLLNDNGASLHEPNFATFVIKVLSSLLFGILASSWLILRSIGSLDSSRFAQKKAMPPGGTGSLSSGTMVASNLKYPTAANSTEMQTMLLPMPHQGQHSQQMFQNRNYTTLCSI